MSIQSIIVLVRWSRGLATHTYKYVNKKEGLDALNGEILLVRIETYFRLSKEKG